MNANLEDLSVLLDVQKIDLAIMQAKKKRTELPQRIKMMRLRKKRGEISEKLDQVLEIERAAKADFTVIEDEDRQLAEKQQRAQEIIDNAGSDYRKVESHSKEMAGMAKRRETLAERMLEKTAELDKIAGVRTQLENAIAASQYEESKIRSSFEEEDNALVDLAKGLAAKRAQLVSTLPDDLVALYEKTAAKTGGVALGVLEEEKCGVCRTLIDGGRLIALKASAPLGVCPNCKRLLIVE